MSNTSINIPEKINVGFQNRKDTFTGKLAYVIYYDNKGKLRKETSWQNWRDKNIPNEEYENLPTEGFVLNKKVGDYVSYWNHRQAYVRVYDPRGFEFEITIQNLLFILENTSSIIGKGLEGEFVYGWDGKDLVLIPVSSPDYQEIKNANDKRKNARKFTAKNMIIGATYQTKDLEEVVYLGRFDYYDYNYVHTGQDKKIASRFNGADYDYNYIKKAKKYWFAQKVKYSWKEEEEIKVFQVSSLTSKIIDVISEESHPEFAFMFEKMETMSSYSPPDSSKNVVTLLEFEDFKKRVDRNYFYHYDFNVSISDVEIDDNVDIMSMDIRTIKRLTFFSKEGYVYDRKDNPNRRAYGYGSSNEPYYIYESLGTLEEFFNKYKPLKLVQYLENGKKYREVW